MRSWVPQPSALLLAPLLALLLLPGCSGSGVSTREITGADLRTLASDHLSAISLFYGWQGVLYQPLPSQQTEPPVFETLPDGSLRITGTSSDGSVFAYLMLPDGTGHGSITFPGGEVYATAWDATVWGPDGQSSEDHIVSTYPSGARLDCRITAEYAHYTHSRWDGTATTPGGQTMHFVLDRMQNDRDQLRLELPGGMVVTLHIPITAMLDYHPDWPRFADGATGTLKVPGHGDMQLAVTGHDRWEQWRFTAADGTMGSFTLREDFSGSGQMQQGGQTVAALGWTADQAGRLDVLGVGLEDVVPSTAARDFRLDRWVRHAAQLGPMPMY